MTGYPDPDLEVATPAGGFEALYRELYAPMVRLAYLLTGRSDIAEDLVQDAFVAVHGRWEQAQDPGAYLRKAVVNGCASWGRRRLVELKHRPPPRDPGLLVADEMWDVLQRLPARQRAAVVLRFYLDLPDAEIAVMLGCRPATVRTSIHRALIQLRGDIKL